MTSDPHLERRVSRLENDRDAIYDILTEVLTTQQEHSRRFDAVDGRLGLMDGRFDAVDGRLGAIEATLVEVVRRLPEPS